MSLYRARGYPDDVRTYGLVSGLWTSMTALGFFLGSSMGGILLHHVGFAWGTTFIIGGQIILVRDINIQQPLSKYYDRNRCIS